MIRFEKDRISHGHHGALFSCEIHYFRIPKDDWENVLDAAKQMGNTCIAFYVPWFVHEMKDGCFDFCGEHGEECDLISWLTLLSRKNVDVILRPGPYIYAEMKNLGLPQWLVEEHPEARIMEYKDGVLRHSEHAFAFAHNNPIFLYYVKRWLKQVIRVCKPYIGKERMISMIQLCNEIPGVDIDDMNPMTLQLHDTDSFFYRFYEKHYQTIEAFNQAYHLSYTSFQELRPWEMMEEKRRYEKDHLRYYYEDYYVRYFKTLKHVYEEEGIQDVVFLHNAYNPRAISLHLEIRKQIPDLYYGIDNYFSLRSIFDERSAAYYCEYAPSFAKAAFQHAPFVLEHESGYWLDVPQVYGKDLYLFTIWSCLGGFQGFNLFLGHEGENKPGMGMLATTHEWQAPIRKDGSKKQSYFDLQQAYHEIINHKEIADGSLVYDLAYSFPFRSGLIWESISEQSEQMFYYLYKCCLQGEVVDFDHEGTSHDIMLYLSDDQMEAEVQNRLLRYVAEGNHLILCGELPVLDAYQQKQTILIDALGIQDYKPRSYDCWGQKILLKETGEEILQDVYPMTDIQTTRLHDCLGESESGNQVFVKIPYGKGICYILSGAIRFQMKSQCHLMDVILKDIGKKKRYESENFRVITKEYQKNSYDFILNPHPFEIEEVIKLYGNEYQAKVMPYEYKEIKHEKEWNFE